MRRILLAVAAVALVLALPIAGVAGYLLGMNTTTHRDGRATTVSRLSPDETILARLIETSISPSLDRMVRVQIQHFESIMATSPVFLSPEQECGGPPGTERLIWSKDGSKLLLVGRHFFVKDDLFLDNGDQLFFLYDVPSGRGWSNAAEPRGNFASLTAGTIEGVEFTEPVRLKE